MYVYTLYNKIYTTIDLRWEPELLILFVVIILCINLTYTIVYINIQI